MVNCKEILLYVRMANKKISVFGFLWRRFRNITFVLVSTIFVFLIHSKLRGPSSDHFHYDIDTRRIPEKVLFRKMKSAKLTWEKRSLNEDDSDPKIFYPKKTTFLIRNPKSHNPSTSMILPQKPPILPQKPSKETKSKAVISEGDLMNRINRKEKSEDSVLKNKHSDHVLTSARIKEDKDVNIQSYNPSLKATPSEHVLRRIWLDEFTSNMPLDLTLILQDILARDFERVNSTAKIVTEGMDTTGRCKRGYFRLKDMNQCHKWLECAEIEKMKTSESLGNGVGKIVNAAKWKGLYDVAVVKLRDDRIKYSMFVNRVQAGVDNILLTQPSPYTTQVVGYCVHGNNTVLVMEGCKHGNFRQFYSGPTFRNLGVINKYKIAIQLVAELDYLHRGLGEPRVNCDLHTPMQSMGQYIVSYDARLFLNDLDELPIVNNTQNKKAVCEVEPYGIMTAPEFLAPEIRYTEEDYKKGKQKKPVDEKSDVWKIPDLVANIMTSDPGHRAFFAYHSDSQYYLKSQLHSIHEKCKAHDPVNRPTAQEVLIRYLRLYQTLSGKQPER